MSPPRSTVMGPMRLESVLPRRVQQSMMSAITIDASVDHHDSKNNGPDPAPRGIDRKEKKVMCVRGFTSNAVFVFYFIWVCVSCARTEVDGWKFKYDTKLEGTRSEHIVGILFHHDNRISADLHHVITPIGEFMYVAKLSWGNDVPPEWIPCIRHADGTSGMIYQPTRVEEALNGKMAAFRTSRLEGDPHSTVDVPNAIKLGYCQAAFEKRPVGLPKDWLFVVPEEVWLSPDKIDEFLKLRANGRFSKPSPSK